MPTTDLKFAVGAVFLALQFSNFSRPGAVTNCTVDCYENRERVEGREVMVVMEHKTGEQGSAKLVMTPVLANRVNNYYRLLRPLLVKPGHDVSNLFILPQSKPVSKPSNLAHFMETALQQSIPTPTLVRKIGCTAAARNLGEAEARVVNRQMCHDPLVSATYYEAVRGKRDAVKAIGILDRLRKGEPRESESAPQTQ